MNYLFSVTYLIHLYFIDFDEHHFHNLQHNIDYLKTRYITALSLVNKCIIFKLPAEVVINTYRNDRKLNLTSEAELQYSTDQSTKIVSY